MICFFYESDDLDIKTSYYISKNYQKMNSSDNSKLKSLVDFKFTEIKLVLIIL